MTVGGCSAHVMRALALLVALIAALAATTSAAAQWSAPQDVSGPGQVELSVAYDDEGTVC